MFILTTTLRSIVVLTAIIILPFSNLFAQVDKGVFAASTITNYNQLSGMPQNSVNDFCFDNLGYLWIATWGGLSRFDGRHFKNDFGNFPTKARIEQLVKKSADTLYALTSERQIIIISHGNVVGFEVYSVKRHGIILANSQTVVPAITFISSNESFKEFGTKNNLAIQYSCLGFNYGPDSSAFIGKDIQLFTSKGIFKTIPLPQHDINLGHLNWNLFVLENKVIVINEQSHCLDVYGIDGKVEHLAFPVSSNTPWRIYRSSDNHSLFAANGTLLFEMRIDHRGGPIRFQPMLDNFRDSVGCHQIFNLNNRYLLFATGSSGFYILHKNSAQTFASPSKIPFANYFYAQALMPDKTTVLTGISFLFNKNGFAGIAKGMEPLYTDPSHYSSLNRTIFKDRSNYYWYTRKMPDSIHLELLKARFPGATDATRMAILKKTITAYFEDSKGNIWFNNDARLGYLEKGTSKYVTVVPALASNEYVNVNIRCYAEDAAGRIIIGTIHGVYMLDPKKEVPYPQKYLLDSTEIHYLSFNKQTGSLWIGTYGKGLWVLKKNGEFLRLPMDKDRNMSIVHYVISDKYNRVWFSTNNGLYVTTQKNIDDFEANHTTQIYYYRFSTYDGLTANEFNGGCQLPMIMQPSGWLTVSSVAGLAWINTREATIEFPGKSLQTEIIHGHKMLPAGVENLDVDAWDNSELIIEVLAPDWSPEYNIQLQYRIIKKDESGEPVWQDVNEQLRVSLPFLGAGDYEIQFRKRTGLNNDDFIYRIINIHKKPYWYKTLYLFPIVLVLIAIIAYLLYLWRMVALRRKNNLLSEKIIEATSSLRDKNDELSKTIQTRDNLITLFNHDLSTPLFYINRLAQSLAETAILKAPHPNAEEVQLLANSTQDLEELMNEMLLWINIQRKNTTIQLMNEAVNVIDLMETNFNLFRNRLQQNNLKTIILVPDPTLIHVDKRLLNSILYNLITNAIKYTRDGVIQIELVEDNLDNDRLCLLVRSKSNALEINETHKEVNFKEINDMIKSNKPQFANEQKRQIGLQLVKSFAAMLQLEVSFVNTAEGTFIVKISGLKLIPE